jgi:hypothetical protein
VSKGACGLFAGDARKGVSYCDFFSQATFMEDISLLFSRQNRKFWYTLLEHNPQRGEKSNLSEPVKPRLLVTENIFQFIPPSSMPFLLINVEPVRGSNR